MDDFRSRVSIRHCFHGLVQEEEYLLGRLFMIFFRRAILICRARAQIMALLRSRSYQPCEECENSKYRKNDAKPKAVDERI
jgi:hypothetical protein